MGGQSVGEDITTTTTVDGDCKDGNSTTTSQAMTITLTCK